MIFTVYAQYIILSKKSKFFHCKLKYVVWLHLEIFCFRLVFLNMNRDFVFVGWSWLCQTIFSHSSKIDSLLPQQLETCRLKVFRSCHHLNILGVEIKLTNYSFRTGRIRTQMLYKDHTFIVHLTIANIRLKFITKIF